MMYFESLNLWEAVWLTFTSASTVGYGDLSASTVQGQISTIVLIFTGGIAAFAQTITVYFDYQNEIKNNMLRGNWSWNMENHIVFLNSPSQNGDEFFYKAITEIRDSKVKDCDIPILVACKSFKGGAPEKIVSLENVVHVSGATSDPEILKSANIVAAKVIVILAQNDFDIYSDSLTFDLIHRLREMKAKGRIIAEVVADHNRNRLRNAGADNVIRPLRTYPEFLARAIITPGSEQILETLFDSRNEECVRYEVNVSAKWSDIVKTLMDKDIGTPIAFLSENNKVITNAPPTMEVNAKAVFTVVNLSKLKTGKEVQVILDVCLA
jgi:voltage-gated potassium channel